MKIISEIHRTYRSSLISLTVPYFQLHSIMPISEVKPRAVTKPSKCVFSRKFKKILKIYPRKNSLFRKDENINEMFANIFPYSS